MDDRKIELAAWEALTNYTKAITLTRRERIFAAAVAAAIAAAFSEYELQLQETER